MTELTENILRRLRRRAHVHTDRCYGRYEPCGEHHAHDMKCGGRPLICGTPSDADLLLLLTEYERLRDQPCHDCKRLLQVTQNGHDQPCYYCKQPCNDLAGDPGLWSIPLTHPEEPGVVKWHHIRCVSERLPD